MHGVTRMYYEYLFLFLAHSYAILEYVLVLFWGELICFAVYSRAVARGNHAPLGDSCPFAPMVTTALYSLKSEYHIPLRVIGH